MEKVLLNIFRLTPSYSNSNVYILILTDMNEDKKLPIVIGENEARAIALELEGLKFMRPLTHELMKNITDAFSITLTEVVIDDFKEGIFYSKLHYTNGETSSKIDARTSDAVALALRYNCPIYTTKDVLQIAGATFSNENDVDNSSQEKNDTDLSLDELQQLLKDAEEKEEYEKASKIMLEIEKRKKNS